MRDIGPHIFVDGDSAGLSDRHAGRLGQFDIRTDADGHQYQIGIKLRAVIQRHRPVVNRDGRPPRVNRNAFCLKIFLQIRRHVRIEKRTDSRQLFHQLNGQAGFGQAFDHLKSDKTGANHNGSPGRIFVQIILDCGCIRRIFECKYVRLFGARQGQNDWICTGRQHERIVPVDEFRTVLQIAHANLFRIRIDGQHFVPDLHVNPVLIPEVRGITGDQHVERGDYTADEIRQTAP